MLHHISIYFTPLINAYRISKAHSRNQAENLKDASCSDASLHYFNEDNSLFFE